ncbi:integrin alpha-PS3 isoform X2 [Eupeodes corollae]|uniref:integrin alpha-PS3 isoform X2 n=1 Tax=Eupeodes corollae TaxID=290404 RepID=UPI002492BA3B|nr:integrin alpha-PS3 isoform X2 [Eupeodes corollae]
MMVQNNYCVVQIVVLTFVFYSTTNGFNFSPKPSFSLREPSLKAFMPKLQSSYFGFTINLRTSSVIVGAPRAQSTLESQRRINETGAIYKCTIATGTCAPFIFDDTGNINDENSAYTYDSEKKDHQWLGASMDGGPRDTDKLVVCAPRLIANLASDYLMHGICYWTPDTLSDNPLRVKEISPLRLQSNQVKEKYGTRYFYHMFGEQGLSVHVTSNNEEIIIGAPGIHTWRGSVIRYHPKSEDDNIGMSRRDLEKHRIPRQTQEIKYTTEVPNPDLWKQDSDSYFGYSVGSGYFDSTLPNKIYYVASAPQANHQSGEVYIFDIIKTPSGEYFSIKKFYTFRGSQFGEYFGYAVLAEDLNGDGLTDLIVTAPQYSSDDIVEQGAIYVFINKGRFVFELQKVIKSPVEGIGRFGSSISKLGDINRDGFNDIAVGAPFAGNGTVFIYLGSAKGLREISSQQLSPGPITTTWSSKPMFGHGLSKGSDIDNNGFNDLAIGAPNAESVFVYRSYPVVKIHATINSLSREIKPDQTKFQIKICYRLSTTSQKIQSQDIAIRVSVDPQVKRVTLLQTNSAELAFNAAVGTENQCRLLDANVRFNTADIFKPIELEMHYDLINGVPDSEEFCDRCAAVDPAEPKVNIEKIIFSTGCKTDICTADLKVTSSGLSPTYILGSSRTISVTYEVTNSGETAYLPQINITSSNKMPFNKKPASCDQHGDVLLCDLNRGQPIFKNDKQSITIVYDVSHIEGSSITLTAAVFSTGQEQNPSDNIVRDFIALREFTEIEAIGKPLTAHINLEKVFNSAEIINSYEIKSSGPSTIQELEIAFEIPIAHKFYGSALPVPVIDVSNITVQGVYNSQLLYVELYQDKTLLLVNPTEISMSSTRTIITENGNQIIYQSSKTNSVQLGKDTDKLYAAGAHRRRRNIEQVAPNNEYIRAAQKKSHELLTEELMGLLPINRTIVFSCLDPETTTCARAVMKVNNFVPDTPITITLKYHVDLNEVNKILIEPWEFFVIITKLDIIKVGDLDGKSTQITRKMEYNVISKHQLYGTPLWVIILAILGGLLVLAAIAYGMHKAGFFRRKTKEEMDKLVQERQEAEDTEDEG